MLNNAQRKLGFRNVIYNIKNGNFFALEPGDQYANLDITTGNNDNANHVGFPVVSSLPTADMQFGDVVALNTDSIPYFYDGTDWRAMYLIGTPDNPGPPDSDWDTVLIRCTYNTDREDVKNNSLDEYIGTTIVGSPSKYGGGSLRIVEDHSVYYGNSTTTADWLNSAFTLEAWIYVDSISEDEDCVLFVKDDCSFIIRQEDSSNFGFYLAIGSTPEEQELLVRTDAFDFQNWYHIAYVRDGTSGELRLFINGASQGSTNLLNDFVDTVTSSFRVGYSGSLYNDFYIDDLRVSNVARYTSDFDPPQEELPTSGD